MLLEVGANTGQSQMMLQEHTILGQHAALLSTVETLEGISQTSPILDLGCGTGAWLKRLHDAGYRNLCGVDRDLEAFGAKEVAHFIAADLDANDDLPQLVNFELVTMIEVIEHVANPQRLVERASRALAPGGHLLITAPNIYSLRARVRFLQSAGVPFFERAAHSIRIVDPEHIHPIVLEAYQRKIFTPLKLSLARVWTYPDSGSHGSRWFARLAARVMRSMLSDDLPGDTLCLLLRKPAS
jgi:SAM-dependent methyltransferase